MSTPNSHGNLSGQEVRDAVRRSAPRVAVIFEAIRIEAMEDLARRNPALFWSGLASGLSWAFPSSPRRRSAPDFRMSHGPPWSPSSAIPSAS